MPARRLALMTAASNSSDDENGQASAAPARSALSWSASTSGLGRGENSIRHISRCYIGPGKRALSSRAPGPPVVKVACMLHALSDVLPVSYDAATGATACPAPAPTDAGLPTAAGS